MNKTNHVERHIDALTNNQKVKDLILHTIDEMEKREFTIEDLRRYNSIIRSSLDIAMNCSEFLLKDK